MRNRVNIEGDIAVIQLNKGMQCRINIEDLGKVDSATNQSWWVNKGLNTYYACVRLKDGRKGQMHRIIMDAPVDKVVDHKNHNGLDNTRGNLKLTDIRGNLLNSRSVLNNPSGYPGVCWDKKSGVWIAKIQVNGKRIHLGQSKDLAEAIGMRKIGEERYL